MLLQTWRHARASFPSALYDRCSLSPCVSRVSRGYHAIPPQGPLSWGIARLCRKHVASIAAQAAVSFLSCYRGYRSYTVVNHGLKRHEDMQSWGEKTYWRVHPRERTLQSRCIFFAYSLSFDLLWGDQGQQ